MSTETAGTILFKHIFRIAPEALGLFSFKDEPNVYESPKFLAHATKVVSTVGVGAAGRVRFFSRAGPEPSPPPARAAVDGLSDLEKLVPVLKGLGTKHVAYGVLPPHYDVVGEALVATLGDALGDKFTDDVKGAWVAVYGIIKATMIGDNYPAVKN